jgi:ferredoxin-type protein NapG
MLQLLAQRLRTPVGRRRLLKHVAVLAAVYVLPLLRWNTAAAAPSRHLRPPGALSEPDFLKKCIRCGLCGDVCPNQCINYFDLGSGKSAGTPYIVPREQGCMLCMKCTQVCPSGSLQPVERTLEDIQAKVKMGRAVLDPNLCYSYNMRTCGVCYRACPLQDVALKIGMYEKPILIAENCVGCGNCERICYHYPQAIRVIPFDDRSPDTTSAIGSA